MEFKHILVDEAKRIAATFLVMFIILYILYFKESLGIIFKFALGLFLMFLLPGVCLTLFLREKVKYVPRLIISFGVGTGIVVLTGYYANLIFNVGFYPAIFIWFVLYCVIGVGVFYYKYKSVKEIKITKNKSGSIKLKKLRKTKQLIKPKK